MKSKRQRSLFDCDKAPQVPSCLTHSSVGGVLKRNSGWFSDRKRKMLESERVVEEHRGKENSARGFSLLSITLAAAMVAVGNLYWWLIVKLHPVSHSGMRSSADLEPRPISTMEEFSALLSTCWALHPHLQNGWKQIEMEPVLSFETRWALKDGKISVSERRLLWFLGVSTSIMLLADLIVVIWVPN